MKIKREELCSYLFIIFVMIFYTIDKGRDNINGILILGFIIGIVAIVISVKMQLETLIIYGLFSIIPIISFLHGHDTRILVLLFAMLCGINLDMHKVVTVMFYIKLICFIIMVFVDGYGHINGMAVQGGTLILLFLCMNEGRMKLWKYLVAILTYIALSVHTRTGSLIVCMAFALLAAVIQWNRENPKIPKIYVVYFTFPILMFANYFFAAGVNEETMPFIGRFIPRFLDKLYINACAYLDKAMSWRLTLTKYSLGSFGVSLWGGNVDYSLLDKGEGKYFNLDSGLMWLLQGGGVILTIGFMILTILLIRYLVKEKHYYYVIVAVTIALWTINEDVLLGIGTNFLIVFMGKAVIDFISERRECQIEHT